MEEADTGQRKRDNGKDREKIRKSQVRRFKQKLRKTRRIGGDRENHRSQREDTV